MKFWMFFVMLLFSITCAASSAMQEYTKMFEVFGEKSLVSYKNDGVEDFLAYRLLWVRSFDDDMIFRLMLKNGNERAYMQVKKVDAKTGELVLDKVVFLNENQIENYRFFSNSFNFWSLPSAIDRDGLDGAAWILEGANDDKHHFTYRWSPLPPYYPSTWDYKQKKVVPMDVPFENQVKHSDEVGLDMFCLLIMLQYGAFNEKIY